MTTSEIALPARPFASYDTVYIDHDHMAPDVPRGSIAFLDPPGYTGEGVYAVAYEGRYLGDLRRIAASPDATGYRLIIDNWPKRDRPVISKLEVMSREELLAMGVRRVAGIARSFTRGFADLLRARAPRAKPFDP